MLDRLDCTFDWQRPNLLLHIDHMSHCKHELRLPIHVQIYAPFFENPELFLKIGPLLLGLARLILDTDAIRVCACQIRGILHSLQS